MSAANYLEAAIVLDGSRNPIVSRRLDEFLRDGGIAIEPVTEAQARDRSRSLSRLWKGQRPSCTTELWRLLRLRSRARPR